VEEIEVPGDSLEKGLFTLPSGNTVTDFARLLLVLEGIDFTNSHQRKRFSLEKVA
jgi:hypothetical protein